MGLAIIRRDIRKTHHRYCSTSSTAQRIGTLLDDGKVTYSDSPTTIDDDDTALIFGTSYKLQYVDPFLFLAYELRRWSLDAARLIVCVGYGFNDDHINGILQQSLRQNRQRKTS